MRLVLAVEIGDRSETIDCQIPRRTLLLIDDTFVMILELCSDLLLFSFEHALLGKLFVFPPHRLKFAPVNHLGNG